MNACHCRYQSYAKGEFDNPIKRKVYKKSATKGQEHDAIERLVKLEESLISDRRTAMEKRKAKKLKKHQEKGEISCSEAAFGYLVLREIFFCFAEELEKGVEEDDEAENGDESGEVEEVNEDDDLELDGEEDEEADDDEEDDSGDEGDQDMVDEDEDVAEEFDDDDDDLEESEEEEEMELPPRKSKKKPMNFKASPKQSANKVAPVPKKNVSAKKSKVEDKVKLTPGAVKLSPKKTLKDRRKSLESSSVVIEKESSKDRPKKRRKSLESGLALASMTEEDDLEVTFKTDKKHKAGKKGLKAKENVDISVAAMIDDFQPEEEPEAVPVKKQKRRKSLESGLLPSKKTKKSQQEYAVVSSVANESELENGEIEIWIPNKKYKGNQESPMKAKKNKASDLVSFTSGVKTPPAFVKKAASKVMSQAEPKNLKQVCSL